MRDGETVVIIDNVKLDISTVPVGILVDGIVNRLLVRNNYEVGGDVRVAIDKILEYVIITRGFDLGAEFAGASPCGDLNPTSTIEVAIKKYLPEYWADKKALILEAFIDLLRRPEPAEERALAELGRLSFGIEIVLKAGRSTIYSLSLPEIIYLDANVVMPAIIPGHPLQRSYLNAIKKIQLAAQSGGRATRVVVTDVFVEETIEHRQRAIHIVDELGLENLRSIRKPITFYGVTDVNVFLGAYSTWLLQRAPGEDPKFAAFLSDVAPYSTEAELAASLTASGIEVIVSRPKSEQDVRDYSDATERLLDAYQAAEVDNPVIKYKATILKKHEARQLLILERDSAAGLRSVFFTADSSLRQAVSKGEFHGLENLLLSNRNLVQLVDLLIGLDVDASSLSRLLWTVPIADDRSALKDYLINRALEHYDAAMLLKLNEIIDAYVEKTLRNAKLEGIELLAKRSNGRVKASRFLDNAEQWLFSELAEEVRKEKEERRNR